MNTCKHIAYFLSVDAKVIKVAPLPDMGESCRSAVENVHTDINVHSHKFRTEYINQYNYIALSDLLECTRFNMVYVGNGFFIVVDSDGTIPNQLATNLFGYPFHGNVCIFKETTSICDGIAIFTIGDVTMKPVAEIQSVFNLYILPILKARDILRTAHTGNEVGRAIDDHERYRHAFERKPITDKNDTHNKHVQYVDELLANVDKMDFTDPSVKAYVKCMFHMYENIWYELRRDMAGQISINTGYAI